jgi:hypothetical protein
VAYLSRETVKWLKTWLDHAKISGGATRRRPRRGANKYLIRKRPGVGRGSFL